MLAHRLALFCLRYLIPADKWPEKWARISLLVDEHRPGLDVLRDAAAARHPPALQVGRQRLFRGPRAQVPDQRHQHADRVAALPGDIVFIAGGAVPTLYIAYLGIRHTVKRVTLEEPDDILFTEITSPRRRAVSGEEATAARLT
jgi:nitric oxide reductase subunit B